MRRSSAKSLVLDPHARLHIEAVRNERPFILREDAGQIDDNVRMRRSQEAGRSHCVMVPGLAVIAAPHDVMRVAHGEPVLGIDIRGRVVVVSTDHRPLIFLHIGLDANFTAAIGRFLETAKQVAAVLRRDIGNKPCSAVLGEIVCCGGIERGDEPGIAGLGFEMTAGEKPARIDVDRLVVAKGQRSIVPLILGIGAVEFLAAVALLVVAVTRKAEPSSILSP